MGHGLSQQAYSRSARRPVAAGARQQSCGEEPVQGIPKIPKSLLTYQNLPAGSCAPLLRGAPQLGCPTSAMGVSCVADC